MPWKGRKGIEKCIILWAGQVPFEDLGRAMEYLFALKLMPMFSKIRASLMTVHRSPKSPCSIRGQQGVSHAFSSYFNS